MAYTANIADLMNDWMFHLTNHIIGRKFNSVLEFGDQVMCLPRTWPGNLKPTRSVFWEPRGVFDYACVDINGKHGAIAKDCNKPFDLGQKWDLVTNVGFSEHLKKQKVVFENMRKHASLYVVHMVPALWFWTENRMHWFYGFRFFEEYAEHTGSMILASELLHIYKRNRDLVCVLMDVSRSHEPEDGFWPAHHHLLRQKGCRITKEML